MNDLISRKMAIYQFRLVVEDEEGNWTADDAVEMLERLPSEEPEHKKGEWVDFTMYDKAATQELCGACGTWSLGMAKNFCPNCGADMRGGDAE